jgi:hypothetical protein
MPRKNSLVANINAGFEEEDHGQAQAQGASSKTVTGRTRGGILARQAH